MQCPQDDSSCRADLNSVPLPLATGPKFAPSPGANPNDWTIDQGWERYTPQQHATWKLLFERQTLLLPNRACQQFVQGMQVLPIGPQEIPDFRRLSDVLVKRTGWQVVAVPGLVPDEVFFEHLSQRRFPAGNFIRRPHELDYLEAPDVFHDVFGHVPMLMNPVIADFMQAYGQGGLRAQRLGHLHRLARLYWYTIEFGLIQEQQDLRLYGAGIASSCAETSFCLADRSPNRLAFCLERVLRTSYRIDDFQETYFVLRNFDQLLEFAQTDFAPIYERVQRLPDILPGALLADDDVISRGTGSHAKAKRAAGRAGRP